MRARFYALIALPIALIFIIGIAVFEYRTDDPAEVHAELFKTLRERPYESRIVNFPYRRLIVSNFQARDFAGPDRSKIVRSVRAVMRSAGRRRSSEETLWADGIVKLISGELEESVEKLELVAKTSRNDPRVLSDLSAAYLALAFQEDNPHARLLGLSAAHKALIAEPSLHEARFNLALALESVYLLDQAQSEWQKYLDADPTSSWALEGARHLDVLRRPRNHLSWEVELPLLEASAESGDLGLVRRVTRRFPRSAMHRVETEYLGRWGEALLSQDRGTAERALSAARVIAAELAGAGDWMAQDTIAAIDRAAVNPHNLKLLAEGHREYSLGRHLYQSGNYNDAKKALERATELLRGRSPLVTVANLYSVLVQQQKALYEEALIGFAKIADECDVSRYPVLAAEFWWGIGFAEIMAGNPSRALSSYEKALASFKRVGDVEGMASVRNLISNALDMVGAYQDAWMHRLAALRLVPEMSNPMNLRNIYFAAAFAALSEGLPEAALYFQDEAVKAAEASDDARLLSEGLLWRSKILASIGRVSDADQDLRKAQNAIARIQDVEARDLAMSNVIFAAAEQRIESDPRQAQEYLTTVLNLYDAKKLHYYRIRGRLMLSDLEIRSGNRSAAEEYLESALDELDKVRTLISNDYLRIQYLDAMSLAFRNFVDLYLRKEGTPEKALEYLEEGRSRVLLDSLSRVVRKTPTLNPELLSVKAAQAKLPQNVALLVYGLLRDRLVIWIVRNDSITFEQRLVKVSTLEDLVHGWRSAMVNGHERRASLMGRRLYNLLIPSGVRANPTINWLVMVPDSFLNLVPFAALQEPGDRYLVQKFGITIAPSVSFYVKALENRREGLQGLDREKILAVANPLLGKWEKLKPLDRAEEEANRITRLSDRALLLVGEAAKRGRVMAGIEGARLIHLATHVQVVERYPWRSNFILAPEDDAIRSSSLSAEDIYQANLSAARLVVLAGCATATGKVSKSEGVLSLVHPFLAGGVPSVVASLWPIEDGSTADFFDKFYSKLDAVDDPALALRLTQLDFIESNDEVLGDPFLWAGFELFGV